MSLLSLPTSRLLLKGGLLSLLSLPTSRLLLKGGLLSLLSLPTSRLLLKGGFCLFCRCLIQGCFLFCFVFFFKVFFWSPQPCKAFEERFLWVCLEGKFHEETARTLRWKIALKAPFVGVAKFS